MNVARLRSPVYALCLSILAVAAACGTADPPPPKGSTPSTGTSGAAGAPGAGGSSSTAGSAGASATGAGGGGTGGSTGVGGMADGTGGGGDATGGAGGTPIPLDPATPLPLIVDSIYAASGFMGDGAVAGAMPAAIVLANGATDCPMRAPGNIGKCSKFTYTPLSTAAGGMGWAGVYWQSPANNWGTLPGKHIAAGATKVTFYAAGAKGGEVVTFIAGGISGGGAYSDPPSKMELANQVLTTTMTQYSIDLTGFTYVSIIGGFGWSIEAPAGSDAGLFDPTPITFYVDAIEWVQ